MKEPPLHVSTQPGNGAGLRSVVRRRLPVLRGMLSGTGLFVGALFFAASLTPTLVPRTYAAEGVLAGLCLAAGYSIGLVCRHLWIYMKLPEPRGPLSRILGLAAASFGVLLAAAMLWQAPQWQNAIRARMDLDPVTGVYSVRIVLVALITFLSVMALVYLFRFAFRAASTRFHRFLPRRVAQVAGLVAVVILFWLVANGVIFRLAFHMLDSSFATYDALLDPELPQPTNPAMIGSPASLLTWDKLGRRGREYVASSPTAAEITAATGRAALKPIRVYAGQRSAETVEQRARLALNELRRVGAFQRSILVVVTPTGTGWIDPAAMNSLEYLHGGDVASVALQYSYFSSPLSLLFEPERGAEAARALFAEVYGYWTTLPKDARPRLYVHGLSLGSLNSEKSVELFEVLGDPIQGALWSGPPFVSRLWRSTTDGRLPGSPAWLPRFRDDAFIRFMNQDGFASPAETPWGVMRIVYLQYASDPVTFFDYRDLYRRPDWMAEPRGPDVSPELRWYPVVTMLQLAFDMAVATTTPIGFGHVFAPEHYVDAWMSVTGIRDWLPDRVAALKQHLRQEMAADLAREGEENPYTGRGG